MINKIYALRKDFMIIGLTGRTGSGCTTVADILTTKNFSDLKSLHKGFREGSITNKTRKDRIIYNFIKENWSAFIKITASDIIMYFAGLQDFDNFVKLAAKASYPQDKLQQNKDKQDQVMSFELHHERFKSAFDGKKDIFEKFSNTIKKIECFLQQKGYQNTQNDDDKNIEQLRLSIDIALNGLSEFKRFTENVVKGIDKSFLPIILQNWGDSIRKNKTIDAELPEVDDAPSALADIIDKFINCITSLKKCTGDSSPTRIVIDALRNPFEILYFRERYAAFYCMSVNTPEKVRHDQLLKKKGFRMEEIIALDMKEGEKKGLKDGYQGIDLIKCIQLSDIFLSHDGTEVNRNRDLINQIITYIALILHPGLVPPTPQERVMQVAYTAKLNSGCLSRQVGAAVTDCHYSVKSIGWNSVPEGQVPCSLRLLDDLVRDEDPDAFSEYESKNERFKSYAISLHKQYDERNRQKLNGISLTYCFKNIYTKRTPNQRYNQVHTRSLHAEENAFLQLVKYGGQSIEGGKLFTTASCCELCAKKAYHLGISEIYYIDSYPGISNSHIFSTGSDEHRPKVILFSGAIGRAYINLYNLFIPLKDEIEFLTNVSVGDDFEGQKIDKPIK